MDILSHPERIDTSRQTHPRDALDCGSLIVHPASRPVCTLPNTPLRADAVLA